MEPEKTARINALARKKRTEGLTPEETAEQQILRSEYLQSFRNHFQQVLENVVVENLDGTRTPLSKKPNS